MWFNIKLFWQRFPYIITTAVFVLALGTNVIFHGPDTVAITLFTFVASIAIVTWTNNRRRAVINYYEAMFAKMTVDLNHDIAFHGARASKWFQHYLSMREDRAAFLKALTAVFPAGYRQEWYVVELPTEASAYARDQDLQWFLYIDLPEDLDLPAHQLRFVVSEREKNMIGPLPDYMHQRVTLLEGESQHALRKYLSNIAYEELKDKETDVVALSAT
jgi:hypothetical protein